MAYMFLRPYQKEQFNCVALPGNPVICSPTGTGKGTLLCHLLEQDKQQGLISLVITPSTSLVSNINDRYCSIFGEPTYVISTYQSQVKRPGKTYNKIYIDECHLTAANSLQTILKQTDYDKLIGFTATPTRLDGKRLSDSYDRIIETHDVQWFIEHNYLSDYKLLTIDNKEIRTGLEGSYSDRLDLQQQILSTKTEISNAVDLWNEHAYGLKTFFFCSGQQHGKDLLERFIESFPEFKFVYIDSASSKKEVKDAIDGFRSGHYVGIFNIDLLVLGIDVPSAECCYLLRFTYSLTRYLQSVGRVLRYAPNKKAMIIDPLGNCLEHGHPNLKREWSLEGKRLSSKEAYCKCCVCQMPLVTRIEASKQLEDNDQYQTICQYCGAFNVYQFNVEPIRRKRSVRQTAIALSEYTGDGKHGMTRVLNHPYMPRHKKLKYIIDAELTVEEKYKMILIIGYSPTVAHKLTMKLKN